MLFPHEHIRTVQNDVLETIDKGIRSKKNLVLHAPTGLGKTVSALAPALTYALEKDLTIFFLTSKHTQHQIALETLKKMQEKFNLKFSAVSLLGKKWLCLQPGTQTLTTGMFHEYCRAVVKDEKCEFYNNFKIKGKVSVQAKALIDGMKHKVVDSKDAIQESMLAKVCPYEISLLLAKQAKVIITDYYYLFHDGIRNSFFKKIDKDLGQCIVIVDEAHNLPKRVKDLASATLSSINLQRAVKEARQFASEETVEIVKEMLNIMNTYAKTFHEKKLNQEKNDVLFNEKYVSKTEFKEKINAIKDYDEIIAEFTLIADGVREVEKQSYLGSIAQFLEQWNGNDEGFARILSLKEKNIILSYRCLDPSIVTANTINGAYATIMMSGTLTPTAMYTALLGVERCEEKSFDNPFPAKNRMNIIIPQTTTKFSSRTDDQYQQIAQVIDKVIKHIPGNAAVFFPSYFLKDAIGKRLHNTKTIFSESSGLSKEERNEILEKFKSYKDSGALLLAVVSGSFGEGIDLPGDYLKGVVIVGLPLQKPDLETQSLIDYYEKKFGKGWDYGYVFPAFTKTIQSAGRCIRSETDKGVIVFLDERYAWPNYSRCFPPDWDMKITLLYEKMIEGFFKK
ncbi:ATP-dependent DNA helicase [Candidatus Woesearchaeota archaeon]|nr:MAG: ATP-dependent DNA helicase [Candidatus Woesearchaeota archaeon]